MVDSGLVHLEMNLVRRQTTQKEKFDETRRSSSLGNCAGIAWMVFASFTGADDWFKSLFRESKTSDLDKRFGGIEKRLDTIEKN